MKPNTNTIKSIAKYLSKMTDDLSFEAEQGWTFSSYYIARYLDEHTYNDTGLDIERSALMATGRLDWLLEESRPTLSGVFSEKDIFTMMNCFQGDVFYPDRIANMAIDIYDDLGIDPEDYESSSFAPLINKILSLTRLQQLALADALERIWYQPSEINAKQPVEVLELLGIQLT